jgi:transcriptional regulator with XRE-family HTH domain
MGSGEGARSRAEPVSPAEQHRLRGSFGWEVVSRRLAARLSQRALSAASGVSLRWLVTLEQGQGRPSDDVCRKLAAGFLPDGSELARAVLDLRLRRAAGESLVMWNRRRPPRVATRRLYTEAAAVLDAEDAAREAEQQANAAVFLEEFRAQWHGDAASARPPLTPAEAWPGRWPRVRG